MSDRTFTPEAKLVLRLGHKFAVKRKLKPSLSTLVHATFAEYEGQFNKLLQERERAGIQGWFNAILNDIHKIKEDKPKKLDLLISKGIRDLKALDIVLKHADKNLGLVPVHWHTYRNMCLDHIGNRDVYTECQQFPIQNIVNRMRNIIGTARAPPYKIAKWLQFADEDTKPSPFYVMPKIHKQKLFASRPVQAQHSYVLTPLSRDLTEVLQKAVEEIPTISKDSKTTAQELDTFFFERPGVFLTYDVEAMYPSIDLNDAISILKENVQALNEKNGFWLKVLQLILFNNYVSFNETVYRQMKGTAIGTCMAPPFANLYFHYRYKNVLENNKILFQRRFIDDGFVIIESKSDATNLMETMSKTTNLKFTYEISNEKAIFLDFEIFKGRRFETQKKLDFKPFFKPTNKFLYLPANSNHPIAMKKAIVKGEAIRCLRNSTNKTEWLKAMDKIFKGLLERGYKPQEISNRFREVRWEQRNHYLFKNKIEKKKPEGVIVLTQYHRETRDVWRKLIAKHSLPRRLHLTRRKYNADQRRIIDTWPPVVVFKDFKKIGQLLISARQNCSQPTGN